MQPELKSALLQAFVQYVVPVLFTGLAALVGLVLAALRKRLEAQASGSAIAAVGAKAVHFAEVVTQDLEATLKPQYEHAAKDGMISESEGRHLREVAIHRVKELLGTKGLEELKGVLGIGSAQLEHYVGGLVEVAVAKLKPSAPSPK